MAFDPDSDSSFSENKTSKNYVKFYRQWKRNNFKSNEQGIEVGEEQDFILIICPGQPKTEVRRRATDNDKHEYPQEWRSYQEGKEHQIAGTPIELLPGLANGMADSLKALYIYTIEQMADLPDGVMYKIGMGANENRMKAKAYLEKGSAEVAILKAKVLELETTIAELRAQLDAKPVKGKPGRKPKLATVA